MRHPGWRNLSRTHVVGVFRTMGWGVVGLHVVAFLTVVTHYRECGECSSGVQ